MGRLRRESICQEEEQEFLGRYHDAAVASSPHIPISEPGYLTVSGAMFTLFHVMQVFVWEACQDTTLIILMVCAAIALATGMKTEVRLLFIGH